MQPSHRPTLLKRGLASIGAALDVVGSFVPLFVVIASAVMLVSSFGIVLAQNGALATVSIMVAIVGAFLLFLGRRSQRSALAGRTGNGLLRAGAALLPDGVGARYAEEWCGEFLDLRSEGAPWWALLTYVIGILLRAVPVLAVTLRLSRVRAVD